MRYFKSLAAFKKHAIKNALRVRKVTVAKTNIYYQGITKTGGYNNNGGVIVGYFNEVAVNKIGTGKGLGHLPAFK